MQVSRTVVYLGKNDSNVPGRGFPPSKEGLVSRLHTTDDPWSSFGGRRRSGLRHTQTQHDPLRHGTEKPRHDTTRFVAKRYETTRRTEI